MMELFRVRVVYGLGDESWDLGEEEEFFEGSAEEVMAEYDLNESEWAMVLEDVLMEDYRHIMLDD